MTNSDDVRFVVTSVRLHDNFDITGKVSCWVMGITPESERTFRIDYKVGKDKSLALQVFGLIRKLSLLLIRHNWNEGNLLRENYPVMTVFEFKEYKELMRKLCDLLKRDFVGFIVFDNETNETRVVFGKIVHTGLDYWGYDNAKYVQLTSLSNSFYSAIEVLGKPDYTIGFYRNYDSNEIDKTYKVVSHWSKDKDSITLTINRNIMYDGSVTNTYHLVVCKEEDSSGENQLSCRSIYTDGKDIANMLKAYMAGKTIPEMFASSFS